MWLRGVTRCWLEQSGPLEHRAGAPVVTGKALCASPRAEVAARNLLRSSLDEKQRLSHAVFCSVIQLSLQVLAKIVGLQNEVAALELGVLIQSRGVQCNLQTVE